jgi:NADH:ubiquinone oxidoreductase subunit 4 (subunit M)
MLMNFMCQDMTSFYVFFEASLAPLFILIGIYGASNKDKAADYILIYTLLSSLFMLLAIALYHYLLGSTDYQTTSLVVLSIDLQCILFLAISIGIAVKTPLVPLHT